MVLLFLLFGRVHFLFIIGNTNKQTESIIQKNAVFIHFKAVVNGEPFITGKKYINAFDEPFSIEKFKFYFCKPAFTNVTRAAIPINKNEYFDRFC
jgi:hypothetical protein